MGCFKANRRGWDNKGEVELIAYISFGSSCPALLKGLARLSAYMDSLHRDPPPDPPPDQVVVVATTTPPGKCRAGSLRVPEKEVEIHTCPNYP